MRTQPENPVSAADGRTTSADNRTEPDRGQSTETAQAAAGAPPVEPVRSDDSPAAETADTATVGDNPPPIAEEADAPEQRMPENSAAVSESDDPPHAADGQTAGGAAPLFESAEWPELADLPANAARAPVAAAWPDWSWLRADFAGSDRPGFLLSDAPAVSGFRIDPSAYAPSAGSDPGAGAAPREGAGQDGPVLEGADAEAYFTPGDEYFYLQWHLQNDGQAGGTPGVDINIVDVWDEYTGSGINIGIVDTGIQFDHPDLQGQFNTTIDYDAWDMDDDPSAVTADENHATAVAGTIGASANNGIGVVGVAFDASLVMYRMEFGASTESQVADNMWHQVDVDISSNSWGFSGYFEDNFNGPAGDPFVEAGAGIENAVEFGRDGLGTVFVFAAGNGREQGQDVNYHSFQNSPYTITVGGFDANGELASFSTPGAALLVSAPAVGIVTTDRTGSDGFIADDDYVAISGTSFSTPQVAGVVALMLEANPDLGYRDVQEILAYSSPLTDPDNSGWSSSGWNDNGATNWNGGGLHFSHDYGFGMLDAHAAVRLAETWQGTSTFDNLVTNTYQWGGSPTRIPDAHARNGKSGVLETTITVTDPLDIDHVQVSLDLDHNWIGDLIITLTSPDGTVSRLVDRPGVWLFNPAGSSQKEIVFDLSSTQHWGETGVGDWTLTIYDEATNDTGVLNDWSLVLWGDPVTNDDIYFYTDEFADLVGSTSTTSSTSASSDTLSDGSETFADGDGSAVTVSSEWYELEEAAKGGQPGPPTGGDDGGGGGGGGGGNGKGKGGSDGGGDSTASARDLLVDDDGGTDTINAAAVTSDTTLDLQPGATSQIAGAALTIDSATTIENAFLGDGNDTVFGNAAANMLDGGRGDDWLQGREGADTLNGGAGADLFVLEAGGGGATTDDADLVLDFEDGIDMIGLLDLGAGDLSFDNSADVTGDGKLDTVISSNAEFLAVVSNSDAVDQNDVQTVTPLV